MALDTAFYLVTTDICRRAGLVGQRYIAPDGRFILDNKDLSRVRFTSDEYINGLDGVEKIDAATAKELIAKGGYNMTPRQESVQAPVSPVEATQEAEEVQEAESPDDEGESAEESTEETTNEEEE